MSTVDISKIEVGDRITLGGEFVVVQVTSDLPPARPIQIRNADCNYTWLTPDMITAHHPKPKPLAVGDRVQRDYGGSTGTLLAVDGKDAWVRWPTGCSTTTIDHLERVS